jgi:hypothetical protein
MVQIPPAGQYKRFICTRLGKKPIKTQHKTKQVKQQIRLQLQQAPYSYHLHSVSLHVIYDSDIVLILMDTTK